MTTKQNSAEKYFYLECICGVLNILSSQKICVMSHGTITVWASFATRNGICGQTTFNLNFWELKEYLEPKPTPNKYFLRPFNIVLYIFETSVPFLCNLQSTFTSLLREQASFWSSYIAISGNSPHPQDILPVWSVQLVLSDEPPLLSRYLAASGALLLSFRKVDAKAFGEKGWCGCISIIQFHCQLQV